MTFVPSFAIAQFLQSSLGEESLALAEKLPLTPKTHLTDLHTLRKKLSAEEAAAVLELALLRRRATAKFTRAKEMLFVRSALEQATRESIAQHRARRYRDFERVIELGCGIGGDTISLAQSTKKVIACDLNHLRLQFAAHNCGVYGVQKRVEFLQTDALRLPFAPSAADAFFADPARRTSAGRRFNPQDFQPSLDALLGKYAKYSLGMKLAPGIDFSLLPTQSEVEIISFAGDAKEAVLWTGKLATPNITRRATLLPFGETLTNASADDCGVDSLGEFLCEPDVAIIRAGLVKQVATKLGLHLLDEHIAYLGASKKIESPLVKCYQIEAKLSLKLKSINRYLRANHIARVNVKQRGTGLSPEKIYRQLKPAKKGVERTLILLRIADEHVALICHPA